MKVLLIMPFVPSLGFTNIYVLEPIPLLTVAAGVVDRHEVKILDLRVEPDSLERTLKEFQPALVGVTANIVEVYEAANILQKVKSIDPDILTVIGGHHVSLRPSDLDYEQIDILVIGEGDITFPELLNAYEAGRDLNRVKGIAYRENGNLHFTKPRDLITDLNGLPLLPRDLVKAYVPRYPVMPQFGSPSSSILTSRGCTGRCNFCSISKFNKGKLRLMSPNRVVRELETIEEAYINIIDDSFFSSVERDRALCRLIKEKGIQKKYFASARTDNITKHRSLIKEWAEIGLIGVAVGIEKTSQKGLDSIDKGTTIENNERAIGVLRDNGIRVYAQFMVEPGWEKKDFDDLIEYIDKMDIDMYEFTITTPLPGTHLFDQLYNEITTRNLVLYDYMHAVTETELSEEEFYKQYANLFKQAYVKMKKQSSENYFWQDISPDRVHEVITQLKIISDHKSYLRENWWKVKA